MNHNDNNYHINKDSPNCEDFGGKCQFLYDRKGHCRKHKTSLKGKNGFWLKNENCKPINEK